MNTYKGIDYGRGISNIDKENGIRYGVISQHSVMSEAMDNFEYVYPGPNCPKCENDAIDIVKFGKENPDIDIDNWDRAKYDCEDFVCEDCKYIFGSESAYGDEPNGFKYEEEGYILTDCLDNDIFIIKSPYYTYAQFCSPCVPGAGNIDNPIEISIPNNYKDTYKSLKEISPNAIPEFIQSLAEMQGIPKTYCLGHDWFENGKAPYPVYSVMTDEEIKI